MRQLFFQDLGKSSRNSSLTKDLESFVGLNKRGWDRGHHPRDGKNKGGHVGHHQCTGRAMSGSERLDIWNGGEVGSLARKESSFRLQGVLNQVMSKSPLQILEQWSYVVRKFSWGEDMEVSGQLGNDHRRPER